MNRNAEVSFLKDPVNDHSVFLPCSSLLVGWIVGVKLKHILRLGEGRPSSFIGKFHSKFDSCMKCHLNYISTI